MNKLQRGERAVELVRRALAFWSCPDGAAYRVVGQPELQQWLAEAGQLLAACAVPVCQYCGAPVARKRGGQYGKTCGSAACRLSARELAARAWRQTTVRYHPGCQTLLKRSVTKP